MGTRTGLDGLGEDLLQHRALIGDTNPVYPRALELLHDVLAGPAAERAITARLERAWKQREFRVFYERPLLLLAALRYEALAGRDHPLAQVFADEPRGERLDREAFVRALDPDRLSLWLVLATRRVQTNDVSRAVAWRWPAALAGDRPLALVDVGCSAGLALVADQLTAPWVDGDGRRLPVDGGPVIARLGFDANPIDLFGDTRSEEAQWLRACIWPGDAARLRRLQAAIEAFALARQSAHPPRVEQVRAKLVPGRLRRLDRELDPHALVLVVQTFVREYIEAGEAEAYRTEMQEWLATIPKGRGLWMQLELAGDDREPTSLLLAQPARSEPIALARCSYHPSTIEVQPGAPERLRAALRP